MNLINRLRYLVTLILLLVMVSIPVWAIDGNEVLSKVDAVVSASEDSISNATMTLIDDDGNEKARNMKISTKHFKDRDNWSLLKFTSPAELRDLGFLSLSDEKMYLYMPAFDRVRRIASHARKESFAGSDLSNDDLSTGKYADHYTAEIKEETETEYVLALNRREGSDRIYPRITAWVDKRGFYASKMDLFDDSGKLWKTNVMENEKIQGYWTPKKIVMTDVRKKHKTVMEITKIEYDAGLKDKIFTERYLKRKVRGR